MKTPSRIVTALLLVNFAVPAIAAADHNYAITGAKAHAFDVYNDGKNTYVEAVKGLTVIGGRREGESLVVEGVKVDIAGSYNGKKINIHFNGQVAHGDGEQEHDYVVAATENVARKSDKQPETAEAQVSLDALQAKMQSVIREQVAAQVEMTLRAKDVARVSLETPAVSSEAKAGAANLSEPKTAVKPTDVAPSNSASPNETPPNTPSAGSKAGAIQDVGVSKAEAIRATNISLFEEATSKDVVNANVIKKGKLINEGLEERAKAEGWTFIWYPKKRWEAIADIDMRHYKSADEAVDDIVTGLREEGKPIQLRISEGNKVMEIFSTEVKND